MGVGTSVKRLDAIQKVTGSAKYVEDLIPLDALHMKVVHSTIANGLVTAIDTTEAERMPGVELIITCFDVPDVEFVTAGHPLSLDPAHADTRDKLILAKRVLYYGDDVAAVIADTPLNAQLAAEKVKVSYETYAPMLTPEASVGADNVMHAFRPTNELARMDFSISPEGDVRWYTGTFSTDEKIAGREDLCGEHYAVPAVHACHLENNTCFAYMDGRRMVVYSCNQVPHTLRRNIAEAIEMPLGDVRVVKPFLGGGFGNKQDTMYEPLVALASQRLGGRCVAITLSREETFVNTRTRHGFDMTIAAAADEAGDLTHRGIRINSNGGSYAAHTHAVAAYAVTSNFQTYKASAVQIGESSTVYTNLPSAAAMRGYGIPQLNFAMESQMEDIARRNGWDPIDFRLQNINESWHGAFFLQNRRLSAPTGKRLVPHCDERRRKRADHGRLRGAWPGIRYGHVPDCLPDHNDSGAEAERLFRAGYGHYTLRQRSLRLPSDVYFRKRRKAGGGKAGGYDSDARCPYIQASQRRAAACIGADLAS